MTLLFDGSLTQRNTPIDGAFTAPIFSIGYGMAENTGRRGGYCVAQAVVDGVAIEVARIALIGGRRVVFEPPDVFGPVRLIAQLLPTEGLPQSLEVALLEATVDVAPETDYEDIEFDPLPSSRGISLGNGRAVFTGDDSDFWKIGARSQERYSSGLISFGAGSGRAVLGLVPEWDTVDFLSVRFAWYIHDFSEARCWDWASDKLATAQSFPWSPSVDLGLRIDGGQVEFQMAGEVVYVSPVPFYGPMHFVCVLGPQAFVFNCNYQE